MSRIAWLSACVLASTSLVSAVEVGEKGIADFPKLSATNDWPWWRGPLRNGVAPGTQRTPVKFGDDENVVWKTPVPGRGHSSPIVAGDRVFLTTADEKEQIHFVLAFDRATGKQLWSHEVSRGGFPAKNHQKNTEATPTIACDGDQLLAAFHHHETVQLASLSLDGKPLWSQKAGPFNPRVYEYGYAPSPLLYRDSVIVAGEYEGQGFIAAFGRNGGQEIWRTPRTGNVSFSSPVVAHVAGKDQLLISGANQIASFNPRDGKPLWSTQGTSLATCGTMVWEGDAVVASGGFPVAGTFAVLADGSGKLLWKNPQKCYEQSLMIHDGHVYALNAGGILFCWKLSDGQEMWKKRLAGPVSSSPVLSGGHIYWANERGTWYVFKPNPQELEMVAENRLGDEAFPSPAVAGGRLFIRTAKTTGDKRQEWLYCLGE